MHNIWFYSDPHFSHANILKFTKADGTPSRPEFKDIEEHDELLIQYYNELVGQFDKVYFLGDVTFKLNRLHSIMPRLNGKKRLILGNHDSFKMTEYMKYFEKIMESWCPIRNVIITHRPILLGEEDHHNRIHVNIHGHTHYHVIKDPRYMNICVEQTNYRPIYGADILNEYKKRGFKLGK